MENSNNVKVFKDTIDKCKTTFVEETKKAMLETKTYTELDYALFCIKDTNEPSITTSWHNGGTVSFGYKIKKELPDKKVAILNFADALTPGGLVSSGASTQEENICRCSNLYPCIAQDKCRNDYYDYNKNFRSIYSDRIIYSKDVLIFKDDVSYEDIDPLYLDVITCPAPSATMTPKKELKICAERIRRIFEVASLNKIDIIIVGAWGCGAFGRNPEIIGKAYKQALQTFENCGELKSLDVMFVVRPTPGHAISNTESELKKGFGISMGTEKKKKYGLGLFH